MTCHLPGLLLVALMFLSGGSARLTYPVPPPAMLPPDWGEENPSGWSTDLDEELDSMGHVQIAPETSWERHSLKCYSCGPSINKTACNERGPTTCPDVSLDTCATILVYKGSSYVLIKNCLPKAYCDTIKVFDGTYSGVTVTTTCCQSDGCNVNAAPRPLGAAHVTLALMGVATSVVVSRALV